MAPVGSYAAVEKELFCDVVARVSMGWPITGPRAGARGAGTSEAKFKVTLSHDPLLAIVT